MRHIWLVAVTSLALSAAAATQDDTPKPKLSKEPLTAEQFAVYRAVLENYRNGFDGPLNVANKTEPLDQTEPTFDKTCVKGLELESADGSALIVHQLSPALAVPSRIILVDPERQQKMVEDNDPQRLMKRAIDDHEKVSENELDRSLKRAFETGLFTFTEIVFDKQHRRAVVAYSFVCGGLCGHGNTVVLKKVGQNWKISKRCSGWVS